MLLKISILMRLRDMSVAATQCAKEHYGVERLVVQFDRLYQELLA